LDPGHPKEHPEQLLSAGEPADPEVPRKRLGAHVVDGDALREPVPFELVRDVEDELVRRTEAGGALRGSDHDRARLVHEASPPLGRVHGSLERGDRVRVAAASESGDHVEVIHVSGGDHEIVVAVHAPCGLDLLRSGVDLRRLSVHEVHPVPLERRRDRDRDVPRRSLPEGNPDERWVEGEPIRLGDNGHVDVGAELALQTQRCRDACEVAAENERLRCHT
jgi:hypothetical protein